MDLSVALAVSPRLLGDALRRALTADGLRLVEQADCDVVVATPDQAAGVTAARVVVLSSDGPRVPGTVSDLAGLRAALQALPGAAQDQQV